MKAAMKPNDRETTVGRRLLGLSKACLLAIVLSLLVACEGNHSFNRQRTDGAGRYWTFYGDIVPGGTSTFNADLTGGTGDYTQVNIEFADGTSLDIQQPGEQVTVDTSGYSSSDIKSITVTGSESGQGVSYTVGE